MGTPQTPAAALPARLIVAELAQQPEHIQRMMARAPEFVTLRMSRYGINAMKYRVTLALTLNPLAGGALCPMIQTVGATDNSTFILGVAMNAEIIAHSNALH
jgi:hypothetical protein